MSQKRKNLWLGCGLALAVGIGFWLLAQKQYYQNLNYTFIVASALLHGHLGVTDAPAWLNELVPAAGGWYYSVFPLGAVLSVLPLSALVTLGLLRDYPVNLLVGILAGGCAVLGYAYTFVRPNFTPQKRLMLGLWLVIGSWFMTNLLFAGAWELALGFAVLGQLGALYWSVVRPRPFLAGLSLAVAFGNRTEVILAAPIIVAFLLRPNWQGHVHWRQFLHTSWLKALWFALAPLMLGWLTLAYNYARFGSVTDFGYAHIPGVLSEPWYQQGIFSLSAVPENAHQMLWAGWKAIPLWPHLVPTGWGGSILLASPFLLLLLRKPKGDRLRVVLAWAAVAVLTLSLWVHGNTGGWQYSYRYAMILLPWFLVLLVEYLPDRVTWLEGGLWVLSLGISAYATYLFLWSSYLTT